MVKQRLGPDARLCDYFDLIGGTSTGSIIAAGLACGMTVEALEKLYRDIGEKIFKPEGVSALLPVWLQGKVAPKFPSQPLQDALDAKLGANTTLGGKEILTGLMIMLKRLDTNSPWPLNNSGHGKYAAQDGELRLTQIVRASTAAPTYFAPQEMTIQSRTGSAVVGAFVDGGVTPFNDPALQLLMLATLQGHGFNWDKGHDKLLLVSVGTGNYRQSRDAKAIVNDLAMLQGVGALQSLMDDCARTNLATLQWLTNCLTPWVIDRAVGDMKLDSAAGPQLATYVRYNAVLEKDWLATQGFNSTDDQIEQLRKMDAPGNMDLLATIGAKAALTQVRAEHLPATFDLARA
jgi:hypothetical protein